RARRSGSPLRIGARRRRADLVRIVRDVLRSASESGALRRVSLGRHRLSAPAGSARSDASRIRVHLRRRPPRGLGARGIAPRCRRGAVAARLPDGGGGTRRPQAVRILHAGGISRPVDWDALWLSVRLAAATTLVLIAIGVPIAYWIVYSPRRWKVIVEAIVALPLVLPPTVLGFYVLVAIGPFSPLGGLYARIAGHGLPFTFDGLLVAS